MEQFTEASLAAVLAKVFSTKKDIEQWLKDLKEKDKVFGNITKSVNGKPKSGSELLADISRSKPSNVTGPEALFSWMVEVSCNIDRIFRLCDICSTSLFWSRAESSFGRMADISCGERAENPNRSQTYCRGNQGENFANHIDADRTAQWKLNPKHWRRSVCLVTYLWSGLTLHTNSAILQPSIPSEPSSTITNKDSDESTAPKASGLEGAASSKKANARKSE